MVEKLSRVMKSTCIPASNLFTVALLGTFLALTIKFNALAKSKAKGIFS